MQSDLIIFTSGLEALRKYAQGLELERQILTYDSSTDDSLSALLLRKYQQQHGSGTYKRIFDYSSIIISIYGYLEKYIESLIGTYIERLNDIVPSYSMLPDQLLKNHLSRSLALIDYLWKTKNNTKIQQEELIANLHSCNTSESDYRLNKDAFSHHTANFRQQVIDQSFELIGISSICTRISTYSLFSDYVNETFPGKDKYRVLEDLAERRNQVAHGDVTDIMQNSDLIQYSEYIERFGICLFEVLQSEIFGYEAEHKCFALGKPYHVYSRGEEESSTPCLELNGVEIKVSDRLIVRTPDGTFFENKVKGLQVNRVDYVNVPPGKEVKVGIKVGFKASTTQIFYLYKQEISKLELEPDGSQLSLFDMDEEVVIDENEDADVVDLEEVETLTLIDFDEPVE